MSSSAIGFIDQAAARQQSTPKLSRRQRRKAKKVARYSYGPYVLVAAGCRWLLAIILLFAVMGASNNINSVLSYRVSWWFYCLSGFGFVLLLVDGALVMRYLPSDETPKPRPRWLRATGKLLLILAVLASGSATGVAFAHRQAGTTDAVNNWHIPVISPLLQRIDDKINGVHHKEPGYVPPPAVDPNVLPPAP